MTESELLIDLHLKNDHQGPGGDRETERGIHSPMHYGLHPSVEDQPLSGAGMDHGAEADRP